VVGQTVGADRRIYERLPSGQALLPRLLRSSTELMKSSFPLLWSSVQSTGRPVWCRGYIWYATPPVRSSRRRARDLRRRENRLPTPSGVTTSSTRSRRTWRPAAPAWSPAPRSWPRRTRRHRPARRAKLDDVPLGRHDSTTAILGQANTHLAPAVGQALYRLLIKLHASNTHISPYQTMMFAPPEAHKFLRQGHLCALKLVPNDDLFSQTLSRFHLRAQQSDPCNFFYFDRPLVSFVYTWPGACHCRS
jgi:hypothetical protein